MEIFLIRVLQFMLAISILVLLHEGGHFFFAKLFGVRVEKFYLFFDPWFHLFEFKPKKSDTTYGVGWLPLGGYCKISGMIDESFDTEQMKRPPQPWEFRTKPAWQRLLIMVGGVLVNFLLALFIYAMILFHWGDTYIPVRNMTNGMSFNADAKALGFRDGDILIGTEKGEFKDFNADLYRDLAEARRVDIVRGGKAMSISLPGDLNMLDMLQKQPQFVRPLIPARVDSVLQGSVAATMGMRPGDMVVGINGKEVGSWNAFVDEIDRMKDVLAVAKTPDYYLTGDDIRIYPGEKFTSENTALWFKHVRVLTYGHYEGRLDNTDNRNTWLFTLLPRPTYNSDDGLGVRGNASFPLNQQGDLHFDIEYIYNSQNGFKPSAWLEKNAKLGTFRFGYGSEESSDNDDNIWATKWPEVQYYMPRLYLGQTGIYIDGSATWGRWAEDGRETGTHYGYRTEITHKPLPLWTRANIRFYSGYRRDWYSVQDAKRSDPYWGAVLSQSINDRLWTTFWYTKHNISGYTPYRFDTIDDPWQKGVSVGYVLTPRDTVIYSMSKNLDSKAIDRYYTWVRDLHSFTAIITYKDEQDDDEWNIFVIPKDFRF